MPTGKIKKYVFRKNPNVSQIRGVRTGMNKGGIGMAVSGESKVHSMRMAKSKIK